jgi:hypothetical protein
MTKLLSLVAVLCLSASLHGVTAVGVCQKAKLGSLLTNSNTTACASDSGVVFMDLDGAPTDAQLTTICETDSCLSLMAAILAIDPDDCTLPLNENLNLMSDLVDPVVATCTSMGIEITGSSKVDSGSGVNVGDDDSAASASASGSSSATIALPPTTFSLIATTIALVLALVQ